MDESVVKHFEDQKVGTLKLSEAIRIGARLRPQCTTGYLFHEGTSCALGAAMEAVGVRYQEHKEHFVEAMQMWPHLSFLCRSITGQNDSSITREQIADWLEEQGY